MYQSTVDLKKKKRIKPKGLEKIHVRI